ncbi:MAG: hypothetical protein AAF487_08845 [Bacteroidota bacterium]
MALFIDFLGFAMLVFAWFVPHILDRSLGTSFYLSDIHISNEPLEFVGGSPILYEHVFWHLNYYEVYIWILALSILTFILAFKHFNK